MTDFEQLADRIYRLERRHRFYHSSFVLLAAIAGLAMMTGMNPAKQLVLTVETLMLTDNSGRIRGLFTAGGDEPSLVLMDSQGVKRLRFRIEDTGPTLSLYDSRQSLKMQMSANDDGAEVTLLNHQQQPRLRLRSGNAEPQIVIHDTEGHPRTKLFVLDGENALGSGLALFDADGKQRILITALPDGESVIRAGEQIVAPIAPAKTAGAANKINAAKK